MKREVTVTFGVEVEVDETKFTPEFMAEYRESYYNFRTIEDHIRHIGQLEVRGILRESFTDGYGPLADFGIRARVTDQETEIVK